MRQDAERKCPACGGPERNIDIYLTTPTEQHGNLEYATCDECGAELVAQDGGPFEVAAP